MDLNFSKNVILSQRKINIYIIICTSQEITIEPTDVVPVSSSVPARKGREPWVLEMYSEDLSILELDIFKTFSFIYIVKLYVG